MLRISCFAATALACAAALTAAPTAARTGAAQGKPGPRAGELRFQDRVHSADALPSEWASDLQQALRPWLEWAARSDCRAELDATKSVLLLLPVAQNPRPEQGALVARTLEALDLALGNSRDRAKPLIVLAQSGHSSTMSSLAEAIASTRPELGEWARAVPSSGGFMLPEPLVGAWTTDGEGREEFDAEGELVHRLAALHCLRTFGRLPHWLATGVAWHAELSQRGKIACFPFRTGFVSVHGHAGWSKELSGLFKSRGKQPLSFEELSALERGSYEETAAAKAWGAATYLLTARPAGLHAALVELGQAHEQESVVHHADGSWQRIGNFELPRERQCEILSKHLGKEWLASAQKAFAGGLAVPRPKSGSKR